MFDNLACLGKDNQLSAVPIKKEQQNIFKGGIFIIGTAGYKTVDGQESERVLSQNRSMTYSSKFMMIVIMTVVFS